MSAFGLPRDVPAAERVRGGRRGRDSRAPQLGRDAAQPGSWRSGYGAHVLCGSRRVQPDSQDIEPVLLCSVGISGADLGRSDTDNDDPAGGDGTVEDWPGTHEVVRGGTGRCDHGAIRSTSNRSLGDRFDVEIWLGAS